MRKSIEVHLMEILGEGRNLLIHLDTPPSRYAIVVRIVWQHRGNEHGVEEAIHPASFSDDSLVEIVDRLRQIIRISEGPHGRHYPKLGEVYRDTDGSLWKISSIDQGRVRMKAEPNEEICDEVSVTNDRWHQMSWVRSPGEVGPQ